MKYLTWAIVSFYRGVLYSSVAMTLAYLLSADPATASFVEFLTLIQGKPFQGLVLLIGLIIAAILLCWKCTSTRSGLLNHSVNGAVAKSE